MNYCVVYTDGDASRVVGPFRTMHAALEYASNGGAVQLMQKPAKPRRKTLLVGVYDIWGTSGKGLRGFYRGKVVLLDDTQMTNAERKVRAAEWAKARGYTHMVFACGVVELDDQKPKKI